MTKYILDSNVLIDIMRGNRALLHRITDAGQENVFISEITAIEVLYGAYISANFEQEIKKTRQIVSLFNTLPMIGAEERICQIKAGLRRKGTPIEDFDMMIAATAIHNGLTLVTANTKHFERIHGLKFENWKNS